MIPKLEFIRMKKDVCMIKCVGKNNIQLIKKYPNIKTIYHLSHISHNRKIDKILNSSLEKEFIPRVPDSIMTGEDARINRICVSSSINGCLSAIGAIKDTIYCVYEPKNIKEVYIYNDDLDKYVPDACITGELWVRNTSIIFVRTKVIKVIKSDIINKKWAYRRFKNEKYKYKSTEFSTECYNMKSFNSLFEQEVKETNIYDKHLLIDKTYEFECIQY